MSDDEIISGFTSLRDAIQRGFARLEQLVVRRFDALEERVLRLERRMESIEAGTLSVQPPSPSEPVDSRLERLAIH